MALNLSLDSLFEQSLFTEDPWWVYILYGANWTIGLAIAAFALAMVIGIIIGTLRTTENRFVSGLCEAWIELFRNIPLIVQIFLWYFVVPELIPPYKDWLIETDPAVAQFVTAFICMGLFTSSRIAEQVRAGIASIPKGLPRAACALGLTTVQTYSKVILPMAMRLIVPPLTSEAMNLVKNTAVALTIGLPELTMRANEMGENTFTFFAAYLWATILYIVIALVVNRLMGWVEKKSAIPGFIAAK
ncbi:amino acid ABC transporter permease [Sutterella sp.]|uniref:amino acid ABC transporter permease n=1 Tax=Sutterella sp. TaxID=1981025 RepID=UPI0026E04A2D|nr:amino acid ABC transporter permease [Sutterella sp.]MDO5530699.1 amino acid ABC transporter permease [Sutterella sp.]